MTSLSWTEIFLGMIIQLGPVWISLVVLFVISMRYKDRWADKCDVFYLTYEFMFAVDLNPKLTEPLINLCSQVRFIQTGYAG